METRNNISSPNSLIASSPNSATHMPASNVRLSVIIPVYNVEQYLQSCVQSVITQTYQNLQVILVNDGSTDSSGVLCNQLAHQDSRIQVLHKENGGLSSARNAGLNVATGEYVLFLDSDDYYADDQVLATLIQELSKWEYPDTLLFCRTDYYEQLQSYYPETHYDEVIINSFRKPMECFAYLLQSQRFNMSACFQILKRSVLMDNDIYFVVGLRNEDIDWSMQLWRHLQSVKVTNLFAYVYRHREKSITTTLCLQDYQSYSYMFDKWNSILSPADKNDLLYLQYLAYIYPTMVYGYLSLKRADRKNAYTILLKHSAILQYASTRKAMRVLLLERVLGLRMAILILSSYATYLKPIIRWIRK